MRKLGTAAVALAAILLAPACGAGDDADTTTSSSDTSQQNENAGGSKDDAAGGDGDKPVADTENGSKGEKDTTKSIKKSDGSSGSGGSGDVDLAKAMPDEKDFPGGYQVKPIDEKMIAELSGASGKVAGDAKVDPPECKNADTQLPKDMNLRAVMASKGEGGAVVVVATGGSDKPFMVDDAKLKTCGEVTSTLDLGQGNEVKTTVSMKKIDAPKVDADKVSAVETTTKAEGGGMKGGSESTREIVAIEDGDVRIGILGIQPSDLDLAQVAKKALAKVDAAR